VRACALFDDGALQCWGGFNFDGELGLGHTDTVKTPGWVAGIRGVQTLALGRTATCAALASGALYCWGRAIPNDFHARTRNSRPVEVAGIAQVVDVALGSDHACAADADGALYCWGNNARGQLGLGAAAVGTPKSEPTRVAGLPPVLGVRADDDVTVAWTTAGRLFVWGQAGGDKSAWRFASPHPVAGLGDVRKAWVTGNHTCALRADKQVRCFSQETLRDFEAGRQHDFGPELAALAAALRKSGLPTTTKRPRPWGPLVVPDGRGLAGAVDVAVFNHDASALTEAGDIYSWGNPERGTVGLPVDSKGFYPPTRIEGIRDAVALAGSFLHRCALDRAGAVACFGEGGAGRLGTDTLRDSPVAVPVGGLPKVVHLASNAHCTFAIAEDHTLWTWGMSWVNACGIEGDGKTPTAKPVPVPLLMTAP
jgi:alpha-tubulin suppressor-like RCC1 family protein